MFTFKSETLIARAGTTTTRINATLQADGCADDGDTEFIGATEVPIDGDTAFIGATEVPIGPLSCIDNTCRRGNFTLEERFALSRLGLPDCGLARSGLPCCEGALCCCHPRLIHIHLPRVVYSAIVALETL
jgi:hypothetical protein